METVKLFLFNPNGQPFKSIIIHKYLSTLFQNNLIDFEE